MTDLKKRAQEVVSYLICWGRVENRQGSKIRNT